MLDDAPSSYQTDPLYSMAQRLLQKGDWKGGLAAVESLTARYPLERDLRMWHQEMVVRASVDEEEKTDVSQQTRRRFKNVTTRVLVGVAVALVAIYGFNLFATWVRARAAEVQQLITEQNRQTELAALLRDAQVWQRAGQLDKARANLAQLAEEDADYPGLQQALALLGTASSLDDRYAQAMQLVAQEKWADAQEILKGIAAEDPNYKDVSLQLANIEKVFVIEELAAEAEAEYRAARWQEAASQFESVRALDPFYNVDFIEGRLFTSYVEAAQTALVEETDLLKALEVAETYFGRALAMRPLNPEIKTQRELARFYLEAQRDYAEGLWSEVISDLEFVYATDSEYANGTTRQTLYEAYVARGDNSLSNGEFDSALSDYQRAIEFAEEEPEAVLRLYEAHIKAGEAHAAQGEYESAVLNYRTAAEIGGLTKRDPADYPALALELAQARGKELHAGTSPNARGLLVHVRRVDQGPRVI